MHTKLNSRTSNKKNEIRKSERDLRGIGIKFLNRMYILSVLALAFYHDCIRALSNAESSITMNNLRFDVMRVVSNMNK